MIDLPYALIQLIINYVKEDRMNIEVIFSRINLDDIKFICNINAKYDGRIYNIISNLEVMTHIDTTIDVVPKMDIKFKNDGQIIFF